MFSFKGNAALDRYGLSGCVPMTLLSELGLSLEHDGGQVSLVDKLLHVSLGIGRIPDHSDSLLGSGRPYRHLSIRKAEMVGLIGTGRSDSRLFRDSVWESVFVSFSCAAFSLWSSRSLLIARVMSASTVGCSRAVSYSLVTSVGEAQHESAKCPGISLVWRAGLLGVTIPERLRAS